MELKVKQGGEIEKIEKITGYQLPNKFKIVGLVLFVVSVLSIITSLKLYLVGVKHYDLFERIALTNMVLGLLIISISREKIEDELIAKIRLQSYNYAVIGTVLLYLILPFIHYAITFSFSSTPKIEGSKDIPLLAVMLAIQIITFKKLKRAYNEE
ncbi:hypothetical protein EKL99_07710 [Flavobacterium sp. ZB4P23]|uniref:hypothetical protein n=1 Tax=Flavobacterium sp. ZB4P23 TaxID=2497484 RepID=UPI000F837905|nr:hypothetical protein [Flavobacterium sp. ZB4P23]RTY82585.1 hypothetical protein EKL99_07710 [Flavobacterium sp. ZB4P23]